MSSGDVERAIRESVADGERLKTAADGAPFTVEQLTPNALVLLLGEGQHKTPVSWQCLEGIPAFLRGKDWVPIGAGKYTTESDPQTLDGYLKRSVNRATASWVAGVLEHAGLVEVDRRRPARVRLKGE